MGKNIAIPTYDRRNGHAPVPYVRFYPDDLYRHRHHRSVRARLLWLLLAVLISCACWYGIIRLVLAIGRAISGGDIS